MSIHETSPEITKSSAPRPARRFHLPTVLLLAAGLTVGGAAFVVYSLSDPDKKEKETPKGVEWSYEKVFPEWPKDKKPDFVIVVSGQTYGFLQKCGCTDPQKGGLERRWNFIEGFKAQGIEVIPIDLGDVAPEVSKDTKILHDQAVLKYGTAMRAMKAMGYRVVGLGKEELALGLIDAIAEYSLQPGNERPTILAANLTGYAALTKAQAFPDAAGTGSSIRDWEIIPTKSKINVGVIGIVDHSLRVAAKKIDPKFDFAEAPKFNEGTILKQAVTDMAKKTQKPNLHVLLYSGPPDNAKKVAKAFPEYRIIVCHSEPQDEEPPNAPLAVGGSKTMIVQVGHKGKNVGVIGVFKDAKGGFDLKYQRVTMSPEFETPEGKEKDNAALQELERYSKTVLGRGFLAMNPKRKHPLQIANSKATYAGSQACIGCHNEQKQDVHGTSGNVWANSKHAAAYNALATIAKKPSLRQFDGDCIRCHTVGYDYEGGFVDAVKTPQLMNVGCESCHGPGSQHVANPANRALALELSPWKIDGKGSLPSVDQLKAYLEEKDQSKKQKIFTQMELRVMLKADAVCQTCHNPENDPHFKFEVFWPKIVHSIKPVNQVNNPPKKNGKDDGPALSPPTGPTLKLPKD